MVDALFKSSMLRISRAGCLQRPNSSKYVTSEMCAELAFVLGRGAHLKGVLRNGEGNCYMTQLELFLSGVEIHWNGLSTIEYI